MRAAENKGQKAFSPLYLLYQYRSPEEKTPTSYENGLEIVLFEIPNIFFISSHSKFLKIF